MPANAQVHSQPDNAAAWSVYYTNLSTWTMEYVRTMVAVAAALMAGQIVLLTQKSISHPYLVVAAFCLTSYTLMFALLTMLTTRNSLYLITRDAAKQLNLVEPRFDPFKVENNERLEKLHFKTAWRHHLNHLIGMLTLLAGIGLTLLSVVLHGPLTR